MSIEELISMLENRQAFNDRSRVAAVQRGDVAQVAIIDADISSTQNTIDRLRTLLP